MQSTRDQFSAADLLLGSEVTEQVTVPLVKRGKGSTPVQHLRETGPDIPEISSQMRVKTPDSSIERIRGLALGTSNAS